MTNTKTEQEPSIEDILESIRQIISDDDAAPKPVDSDLTLRGEEASLPSSGPTLDLAPAAEPPPSPSSLSLSPTPAAPEMAVALDLTPKQETFAASDLDLGVLDLADAMVAPPKKVAPPETSAPAMGQSMTKNETLTPSVPLLSEQAASAATESFAKLMSGSVPIERAADGRITLEDITRELLKPMIKSWLDQNLPGITEKIVQREVEKLSRRVSDV